MKFCEFLSEAITNNRIKDSFQICKRRFQLYFILIFLNQECYEMTELFSNFKIPFWLKSRYSSASQCDQTEILKLANNCVFLYHFHFEKKFRHEVESFTYLEISEVFHLVINHEKIHFLNLLPDFPEWYSFLVIRVFKVTKSLKV